MADNEKDVLINFVGKTDELQPAENALDNIIEKEGAIGDAWKKTSAVINDESKKNIDTSNKLAKSIQGMADAAKSMDKVVIAGAYKQYLQQIQAQLGLTNKELISYVQNARKAAQESVVNATSDQDAKDLTLTIEVMNDQLVELQKNSGDSGDKMSYLRTRLQEAKEQFAELAAAGIQTGPVFDAAKAKLEDLANQMRVVNEATANLGSQHKNLDGLISLAGGVAGGFAVAEGAAALFGNQNEDVQKALLKVNAAMSILQGLTAVQNALQKESAASLFLNNLFRKEAVATTTAQATATEGLVVAEGEQVVSTEAATVAQVGLNTAMELNPVGIVIVGVLALVAALSLLNNENSASEEIQRNANEALKQATEYLDIDLKAQDHATQRAVANAKLRGASTTEVLKIEGDAGNARLRIINEQIKATGEAYNKEQDQINLLNKYDISVSEETLKAHQKLYDTQLDLEKKLQDESIALEVKAAEYKKQLSDNELKSFIGFQEAKVAATIAGSDAERVAQIQMIRDTAKARKELSPDLTPGEVAKIDAEADRQIRGLELQNYQHYLKGRTALYDAYVAEQKLLIIQNATDSIESINKVTDLEIAALKKRRDEALKSDPNLNKGETLKIVAESNLAIAELEKQQQLKLYDIQKSAINAKLILVQKGTQAEYDLKVSASLVQEAQDLSATEITEEKRLEILAKYDKIRKDALLVLQQQKLQDEISYLNAYLNVFGLNEDRKLELTINRLDHQRDLEISQAEGNQAKIKEINTKYDNLIIESKKATIKTITDDQVKQFETFTAIANAAYQKIYSSEKSTLKQRKDASNQMLTIELDNLQLQQDGLEKEKAAGVITETDYDTAVQDINNKRAAATIANEERITAATNKEIALRVDKLKAVFSVFQKGLQDTLGQTGFSVLVSELQNLSVVIYDTMEKLKAKTITDVQAIKAIAEAAIAATQAVVNQIFSDAAAARAQALSDEITALEDQKTKELNAENLSAQNKADIAARYKQKEDQQKLAAWKADKDAKKSQAIINGALAATLAFAEYVWPFNLIVAGITAALTAVEVAQINSTSPPKFKHGKGKGSFQGFGIVDDGGRNEPIVRADGSIEMSTGRAKDRITYLGRDDMVFPSMDHFIKHFDFPQLPDEAHPVLQGMSIDYLQLAKAVAMEMKGIIPAPAHLHNTFDKDGFHSYIQQGSSRTEYKNRRYSMKPDS